MVLEIAEASCKTDWFVEMMEAEEAAIHIELEELEQAQVEESPAASPCEP